MDLSSNLLGQDCALAKFSSIKDSAKSHNQVFDLIIQGLPQNAEAGDIKKIAGVKHVVEATVEQDSIRNICTGLGKIKVRLGDGEDLNSLKQ